MEPRRRRRTRSHVTEAPAEPVMKTVVEKTPTLERSPMRSSMSADDRARADARTAEILGDDSMLTTGEDKFHVDPSVVPDGWTYEWKRWTVYNKEDPQYRTVIDRGGWENVPTERHPELMPPGSAEAFIHLDGLMLMERPKAVTDKVKARDLLAARNQVRAKEEQLASAPAGTFERGTHPGAPVAVKKGYGPVEIPRD
jgi:hypothetical protein